ncbi:MAG: hypothetical protein JXA82_00610 [Sedimentisphaerales bacterium]|nr:hypothetical protein [Sedimentisphaerales bacterium]
MPLWQISIFCIRIGHAHEVGFVEWGWPSQKGPPRKTTGGLTPMADPSVALCALGGRKKTLDPGFPRLRSGQATPEITERGSNHRTIGVFAA